jgi:hypothetical protein
MGASGAEGFKFLTGSFVPFNGCGNAWATIVFTHHLAAMAGPMSASRKGKPHLLFRSQNGPSCFALCLKADATVKAVDLALPSPTDDAREHASDHS